MSLTIGQTIQQLHFALRDYIEATYHVSHPALINQRRTLLNKLGVIHQKPYLESTPRYQPGPAFSTLGLDSAALEVFTLVSQKKGELGVLLHDPPYQHQASATKLSLVDGRSIVVMTGTGSGKTECFLLPILGKLAKEAKATGVKFKETSAVRALVLYPMNALVNDQLGRMRLLFGDPRVVNTFMKWSGRPVRFARYTSRTLYPGVRDIEKDQRRLRPIGKYYVSNQEVADNPENPRHQSALKLVNELKKRGKWPGKPNLIDWFGSGRWKNATGAYKRCITLPDDPELITRHEVHEAPPDVLITNYSMLEYMLMRPLERPIFNHTRDWLKENPKERFLLVIDEAHLYRGAAGAEVGLLIRRLRMRLGIGPERLQVICTSASFEESDHAIKFGAELTGKEDTDFDIVKGDLLLRSGASSGSLEDAKALGAINLESFYESDSEGGRLALVTDFLKYRRVPPPHQLQSALYQALISFGPMARLINITMNEAQPLENLAEMLFEGVDPQLAAHAVTALIALGSLARPDDTQPGLLPCRVHSFYRGLPGLWICMDPDCAYLPKDHPRGPAGTLYSQPRDMCECGARVLEFFTCRDCGSAYARAYSDNIEDPNFLWSEPGGAFKTHSGQVDEFEPLDLLLETPTTEEVVPADFDLITGRLNPKTEGTRVRQVFLRKVPLVAPDSENEVRNSRPGQFQPCAVCGGSASYGRSSVQDHQTKGDQPFQALVTKQLQVQPPNSEKSTQFAPLRGRKVLIFSDSRQTAARLAPNLQTYSTVDALRPLIVYGYATLESRTNLKPYLCLEDLYLGVLLAAKSLGVRLRPELNSGENFQGLSAVEDAIRDGVLAPQGDLLPLLLEIRASAPPMSLLRSITKVLADRHLGLESLALASLGERSKHTPVIEALPDIPVYATSSEQKLALARLWLRGWRRVGFWLSRMPAVWSGTKEGVQTHTGKFKEIKNFLNTKQANTIFEREWLPKLLSIFTEPMGPGKYRLKGSELSLHIGGEWAYCQACRIAQRPFPGQTTCLSCGEGVTSRLDPNKDPAFTARKGYYRASTLEALQDPPIPPIALIAAEHTAQLNTAQAEDVFSKAEENELLFQDVDLGPEDDGRDRAAIDVLSCTTTMEVGIDIGTLSGVALRNMPPGRANYQQRAGRAGRRGTAVATVIAFGSADSYDEHYFTNPDEMIRGKVIDPTLTLDNREIARRHVTAYLLQRYHQDKLPNIRPEDQPQLFAVLGKVHEFKNPRKQLNRIDFEDWLRTNEAVLKEEISGWLPKQLSRIDHQWLLTTLINQTLSAIDEAIEFQPGEDNVDDNNSGEANTAVGAAEENVGNLEVPDEVGEEIPGGDPSHDNLLDRLLYKGVLPRYAFPTDVATFHVFDLDRSTPYNPAFRFTPSQGLPAALSQYAPGKDIWIGNKLWRSGALYSPMKSDLFIAWGKRKLYYECSNCHYAKTTKIEDGDRAQSLNCEACGGEGTLGPARFWLRPPGFAHPCSDPEGTSPDDQPAKSYATHAKLEAPTPADETNWTKLNECIRVHSTRQSLLVTNRGPREEGYTYCTKCGLIEPTALPQSMVHSAHRKPFPDRKEQNCPGGGATRGLVLGTDFYTDVLLISMRVQQPITLMPAYLATNVVLRTISEAICKAACAKLELEPNELQAEFRPALTDAGRAGMEAEIFLYDTLPGGAGFAQQVGLIGLDVFKDALHLLESCSDKCDRSCYCCLRSYKNKFEHDLLDRHLGASLLRYLLTGDPPTMTADRLEKSTDLLFQDLERQGVDGLLLERNQLLTLPGTGDVIAPILATLPTKARFVIGLYGPLTPDHAQDVALNDLKEFSATVPVILVDELIVRRNLPRATSDLLSRLGEGKV